MDVAPSRKAVTVETSEPARYLVLGDFGGRITEPLAVDRDNIDSVLARLDVSLGRLTFSEVEDFHPDRLFARLDLFRELDEPPEPPPPAYSGSGAVAKPDLEKILKPGSLLDQITGGSDPFQDYVSELGRAHTIPKKAPDTARVTALAERMNGLLHHARFQALEAVWRGMDFVARSAEDENTRVHMTQMSKDELAADLANESLRATRLYALISSRRWAGIVGLYTFTKAPDDIELLGKIALLAGHAKAPFVAGGSMDMGPFWQELRSIPESNYIGLALPRIMLRPPYGPSTSAIESFEYNEMPGQPVHEDYLWGNPALACLAVLVRDGALDIEGVPTHSWQDEGEWKMTPGAERYLTDDQVEALIDVGLMPIVSFRDSDRVRLTGFRAINSRALPVGTSR